MEGSFSENLQWHVLEKKPPARPKKSTATRTSKGKKRVKPWDSQLISHLVDLFRLVKVINNKQNIQASHASPTNAQFVDVPFPTQKIVSTIHLRPTRSLEMVENKWETEAFFTPKSVVFA